MTSLLRIEYSRPENSWHPKTWIDKELWRPEKIDWNNPAHVARWKKEQIAKLESRWSQNKQRFSPLPVLANPLLSGIPERAGAVDFDRALDFEIGNELLTWEEESITGHAHRMEKGANNGKYSKPKNSRYVAPTFIAPDPRGPGFIYSELGNRASEYHKRKAEALYPTHPKKAARVVACDLIGATVECRSGHQFRISYDCNLRFCAKCGPLAASRLFEKHRDPLFAVAFDMLRCKDPKCSECTEENFKNQRLPHVADGQRTKRGKVLATIDFTLKNRGYVDSNMVKDFNEKIKAFVRWIRKTHHLQKGDIGLAYCDELGGGNYNLHAHGIYVGPYISKRKAKLKWLELTGDSYVVNIDYRTDFGAALWHAIKYPDKFSDEQRSSPERSAELEIIFHKTKRFHTLQAFYHPNVPKKEKDESELPIGHCPELVDGKPCGAALSQPGPWQPLTELRAANIPDLWERRAQLKKLKPVGAGAGGGEGP